jgi:hypothetical protein
MPERDARVAAERIATAQNPSVMGTIVEYLDSGLNQEQRDYLDYLRRQRQLQISLNSSLVGIDEQKQRLAAVRKSLATLATTPDDITELEMLYAFGVGVRNQLNSTNSVVANKK